MLTDEEIIKKYKEIEYFYEPHEEYEGTFKKSKLKNKLMKKRKGYHLNPQTYGLEETPQTWEKKYDKFK
jgi:hypothetical protein